MNIDVTHLQELIAQRDAAYDRLMAASEENRKASNAYEDACSAVHNARQALWLLVDSRERESYEIA